MNVLLFDFKLILVSFYSGGDCVFWEFCGRDDFLVSYHNALNYRQPAVHLITISLREPLTVQLQQARFWLQFIMDRIPPTEIGRNQFSLFSFKSNAFNWTI